MSLKVLVSEDEEPWREHILAETLRRKGYTVRTAASIDETVHILHREFFHIVIVDLSFSEDHTVFEGRRTMQLLKTLEEGTKSIVLTAWGTVDAAVEALKDFQVFDFLQKGKGFEIEKLVSTVKKAADEVKISAMNYRLGIPVETVLCGFRLRDIASTIGEKEGEIRWLVLNLMNEALPAIFSDTQGELIQTGVGRVFKRPFWSRMLGLALVIAFGSPEAAHLFCSDFGTVVKRSNTPKAVGCLLGASDLSFDDFPKPARLRVEHGTEQ